MQNAKAYTYILQCSDGSYYVGSISNLELRLKEHNDGQSSYTCAHLPVKLVYKEEYDTLTEARHREMQLHKWSRIKKEKLINGEWTRPEHY